MNELEKWADILAHPHTLIKIDEHKHETNIVVYGLHGNVYGIFVNGRRVA
jgi:hypothetical protein